VAVALLGAVLAQPAPAAAKPSGDLTLAKADSPDPATVGEPLTYTLTVKNGGVSTVTGVILSDSLPAAVSFQSAASSQGTCSHANGTVTCDLGNVASGSTANATIVVEPVETGTVTNTAVLRSNRSQNEAQASTETEILAPGLKCGQVVTENTVLRRDVGPCRGNGLIIGADGITLDLGGHRVFGFPGPSDPDCSTLPPDALCGNEAGIRLPRRSNVRIQNGTVSDFDAGIAIFGGGSNTVTNMMVRDNIGPANPFDALLGDGILVLGSTNNRIINNTITHNGIFDGIGVLEAAADDNTIQGNTIEDTVGEGASGQGIVVNAFDGSFDGGTISATRIFGNVIRRNGFHGISNVNGVLSRIESNTVTNNGLANGPGNGIGVQLGPDIKNLSTEVLVQNNEVHGNGRDGINIRRFATGNVIVSNNAADNAVADTSGDPFSDLELDGRAYDEPYVDLRDGNLACAGNVWTANTWGNAYYNAVCVTAGGSGPQPTTPIVQDPDDVGGTALDIVRRVSRNLQSLLT
jgi:uncharacterized repeat protein (TIGR01451 family)